MYIVLKLAKEYVMDISGTQDYLVFDTATSTTEVLSGDTIIDYCSYYDIDNTNLLHGGLPDKYYLDDSFVQNTVLKEDNVFLLIKTDNMGAVWYNDTGALVRHFPRNGFLFINYLIPLSVPNAEYFHESYDTFLKRIMLEVV